MRGGGGGGMGRGGGARRGGAPSGAATQCEHGSGSVVSGVQCIIVRAQLRQTEGRRGSPARSGDAAAAAERMSRGGGRVWQLVTPSEGGGFQEVRDVVLFALGNEGGRACALRVLHESLVAIRTRVKRKGCRCLWEHRAPRWHRSNG